MISSLLDRGHHPAYVFPRLQTIQQATSVTSGSGYAVNREWESTVDSGSGH